MSAWPVELRVDAGRSVLKVAFESGASFALPAEYLRVESPSAEVQGHSAAQKQIVTGKSSVRIVSVEPVGNYALRLHFDDGHNTGLYSWAVLHELGTRHAANWSRYLERCAQAGRREPP